MFIVHFIKCYFCEVMKSIFPLEDLFHHLLYTPVIWSMLYSSFPFKDMLLWKSSSKFLSQWLPCDKIRNNKSIHALHIESREPEEPAVAKEELAEENYQEEELGAGVFSEEGDSKWFDFIDQLGQGFWGKQLFTTLFSYMHYVYLYICGIITFRSCLKPLQRYTNFPTVNTRHSRTIDLLCLVWIGFW